jgi:DNA-binding LytR/AlgR family response regulator
LIVFTTARHEFAVQAFELDALDYLVKPISFERFEKTIRKAAEYLGSPARSLPAHASGPNDASSQNAPSPQDALFIKSDHRTVKLLYTEIVLIEGLNEYVRVHTPGKKIITLAALKDLEAMLPRDQFIRIHRSYIISLAHIRSWSASEVEMGGGLRLPVGRVYKENFLRRVRS